MYNLLSLHVAGHTTVYITQLHKMAHCNIVTNLGIIATCTLLHSSFPLSLKFSTDLVHFLIQIYSLLIVKWQNRTGAPLVSGCPIRHDPDAGPSGQHPHVPSFLPLATSGDEKLPGEKIFSDGGASCLWLLCIEHASFHLSDSWNFETASRFLENLWAPDHHTTQIELLPFPV